MMTANHLSAHQIENNSISQIFLDLDMSIVAADVQRYTAYTQEVRQEYSHYSDKDFAAGRLQFLKGLVGKEIFKSDLFKELNTPAQLNIQNEIKILEAQVEQIETDL